MTGDVGTCGVCFGFCSASEELLSLLWWAELLLPFHARNRSQRPAGERRARRDVGLGEAVAREEAQNVGGLGSAVPMDSGHLCGAAGVQGVRLVGILGRHLVRLQVRETATEGT